MPAFFLNDQNLKSASLRYDVTGVSPGINSPPERPGRQTWRTHLPGLYN